MIDWLSARMTMGRATAAIGLACCAAIALVLAAPLLTAVGGGLAGLGALIYAFFDPICHQLAERSFRLHEHPLAVCHRCFGFYVGFTAAVILPRLAFPFRGWLLARPRRILFLLAPTAIDWLLPMNTPASRFGTALLAGAAIAVLAGGALAEAFAQRPAAAPERRA